MKLLTFVGFLALVAGIGCQSAISTTPDRADSAPVTAKQLKAESPDSAVAEADSTSNETGDEAPRMALEDAKKAFDKDEAIFIDTRGTALFENEHVKGAINIPASDIENRYQEVPKDKKIIVYCS